MVIMVLLHRDHEKMGFLKIFQKLRFFHIKNVFFKIFGKTFFLVRKNHKIENLSPKVQDCAKKTSI